MRKTTPGMMIFLTVFAFAVSAAADDTPSVRREQKVAVVQSVEITGETTILGLADGSTLEVHGDLRLRHARSREDRDERTTRRAAARAGERARQRIVTPADLADLIESSGPQAVLLTLRYDAGGRIGAARGELYPSEKAAMSRMDQRAAARAAAAARRPAPPSN